MDNILSIKAINNTLYCLNKNGSIPFAGFVYVKPYNNHNIGLYRNGEGKVLYIFSMYPNKTYAAILDFRDGAINQFYNQNGTQVSFEKFREINFDIVWDLFHYVRRYIVYAIKPDFSDKVLRFQNYLSLAGKYWISIGYDGDFIELFSMTDYEKRNDYVIPIFTRIHFDPNFLIKSSENGIRLGINNLTDGSYYLLNNREKEEINRILNNDFRERQFSQGDNLEAFVEIRDICEQAIERQHF